MLVATQRGRERTAAEYGALLRATGFARPEVRRMQNVLERHSVRSLTQAFLCARGYSCRG